MREKQVSSINYTFAESLDVQYKPPAYNNLCWLLTSLKLHCKHFTNCRYTHYNSTTKKSVMKTSVFWYCYGKYGWSDNSTKNLSRKYPAFGTDIEEMVDLTLIVLSSDLMTSAFFHIPIHSACFAIVQCIVLIVSIVEHWIMIPFYLTTLKLHSIDSDKHGVLKIIMRQWQIIFSIEIGHESSNKYLF